MILQPLGGSHVGPTLHFSPMPIQTDASSSGPNYGVPHPAASNALGGQNQFAFNLNNDPLYAQLQKQIAAENQANQAQTTTGFGQLLGQYGNLPDLAQAAGELGLNANSPLYQMLFSAANNPDTVASANALNQAGLSTSAQLQQQQQIAISNLMNNLASRGAVQSGDTGTGLRLADQTAAQNQYNAEQTLLQHLQSLIGTYNANSQNDIQQLQAGASQAAARQIALNPGVSGATAAALVSALASAFPATTTAGATNAGTSTG